MTLHGGQAVVNGRRSDTSLYDFDLATYDTGDTFDQSQARGLHRAVGHVRQGRLQAATMRVAGK